MQLSANTELQSGKYRIIRVLGQGGFGITYLAEHTMLEKMVAIKEFFPKEYCDRDENTSHLTIGTKNSVEIVEMLKTKFIKEAKNISKLHHPNIITIHDIFQENETAYYVMEYVDGVSLSQMIKEHGALSETKAIGYISKVADAVGYMHSLSMNHLDLKPANIMIRVEDNEPILIDFGLSKQYDASGGQTSTTPVGISHGFAPVEQYRPGGVATFTPQTDIYALGATLFNLLTGSVPPHYSEILEDGLSVLPVFVSEQCSNAVEHAMEIKKNKRPSSVEIFLSELYGTESSESKKQETHPNLLEPLMVKESDLISDSINKPLQTSKDELENTLMISDCVSKDEYKSLDKSITIDGVEFVDLGLSVKWSTMNFAYLVSNGVIRYKGQTYNINNFQWKKSLPKIENFVELANRCEWVFFKDFKDYPYYKVTGPNGRSIVIPISENYNYFAVDGHKRLSPTIIRNLLKIESNDNRPSFLRLIL